MVTPFDFVVVDEALFSPSLTRNYASRSKIGLNNSIKIGFISKGKPGLKIELQHFALRFDDPSALVRSRICAIAEQLFRLRAHFGSLRSGAHEADDA
jgi:hypothetical protein